MSSDFHSKYWAHLLTLSSAAGSMEGLSRSISSSRVDLNPHQIDAALFALRSPLSRGVILADEVGLGKTIEAGLVVAQRWAERKRRILLIVPATLRKQWQQEISEKFGLPCLILESRNFNEARRGGRANPFDVPDSLVLCSYNFAAAKADVVRAVPWDLVVVDEAHRLRNVYKPGNKMSTALTGATAHAPKVLLTATPLQNSLMELFGLVSVIDPHVFGDVTSFREQFLRPDQGEKQRNNALKERLSLLCRRTLRRQVTEYIRFTQRVPLTQEFLPTDEEHELYEAMSEYLQREVLVALPASQRSLMTLVLRKLLASSTFAIAGTLRRLVERLEKLQAGSLSSGDNDVLDEDEFDTLGELADEWGDDVGSGCDPRAVAGAALLADELEELRHYADTAERIHYNAKGAALLTALETALKRAGDLGAARKAVIFTESVRTQRYLFELLSREGYDGKIVLINGSNADPQSRAIYDAWAERHRHDGKVSGSRSADTKAALVDEFRDRSSILIATESAAEGVNLQFCSLVINFDLPWNPQRIEQRIGRCHRYGQKHDVVVVNFLNRRNAADQRVFELLSEKFKLFDGVFGASDEVLGALESGVDLEKRIAQVYQECRSAEEIQAAFDALQAELEETIHAKMADTRRSLLENFDAEVSARLKVYREQAQAALSERQQWLYMLTRYEAHRIAVWDRSAPAFTMATFPMELPSNIDAIDRAKVIGGRYHFDWRAAEAAGEFFYHPDHPVAQGFIKSALARQLTPMEITIDYTGANTVISALQPLIGQSGWLRLSKLICHSLQQEEFLLLAGCTKSGQPLDEDICQKLLSLPGKPTTEVKVPASPPALEQAEVSLRGIYLADIDSRNSTYFGEEQDKLDRWADDLKYNVEREIKELDKGIKEARRQASGAVALADKLQAQRDLRTLESKRSQKRRELYEAQDAIDAQRDSLIAAIEQQLQRRETLETIFTIRWHLK